MSLELQPDPEEEPFLPKGGYLKSRKTNRRNVVWIMLGISTLLVVLLVHCAGFSASTPSIPSPLPGLDFLPKDIFNLSWAQYSPWFPAAAYTPPPDHCTITQVNLLERHGARFPTSSAGKRIQSAVSKLQSASEFKDPRLDFLKNFTYDLGSDDLVRFGAMQAQSSALTLAHRYPHLTDPFIRASSSQRVVDSATNWTQGWFLTTGKRAELSVILSEDGNDTLDDAMCPSAGSSDPETNTWLATFFPPITVFFNTNAPGANLTDTDTFNLMSLCPFETLAKEKRSAFCDLFTGEQFKGFEYAGDLDKYYGTGYGQPLGRIQGVGYTNELLARLQNHPVSDHTQTNRTLDSNPTTFPLDREIYADFSHDNQMIAIFAAMGMFNFTSAKGGGGGGLVDGGLDPTRMVESRGWRANLMVPFGGRMVVERMDCSSLRSVISTSSSPSSIGSTSSSSPSSSSKSGKGTFVRILVNDAVQPLDFCGADSNGLCTLEDFVESQGYARADGEGDFEKCFE